MTREHLETSEAAFTLTTATHTHSMDFSSTAPCLMAFSAMVQCDAATCYMLGATVPDLH